MHALINIYACNNNLKLINIINKMLVYYIVIVCIYIYPHRVDIFSVLYHQGERFTGQKNAFSTLFTTIWYGKNHIDMEYDEVTKK